jgi:DHA1 family tetracycline resistance protein-like MFS transporter
MVGAAFGVGFILGPAIGGLLGELGPRAPFFAASALAAANLLFGILVLPESLPPERRRAFSLARANPLGAALAIGHFPSLLGLVIVALLYLVGNNVFPSTWAFFMSARFNLSPGMIGLTLVATGTAMATVQFFLTGPIVHRIGEQRAATLGLVASSLGCLAFAFAPRFWMIFVITFVGALQALAYPSLNALMTQQVPPTRQGELQGAIASLSSLASIFGPIVMTQTLAHFSQPGVTPYFPGAAFVLTAFLSATGAVLLLLQLPREKVVVAEP